MSSFRGPCWCGSPADGSCGAVLPYLTQFYDESDGLAGARSVNVGPNETITAVNARLRLPKPTHALTLATAGVGSGRVTAGALSCTTTCFAQVEEGTAVSVIAVPDVGSTFAGWSSACAGAAACTFPMGSSAATVTATFAKPVATATATATATTSHATATATATRDRHPDRGRRDTAARRVPDPDRRSRTGVHRQAGREAKSGKLKVALKCDARATLTLTGTVKVGRSTLKLKAVKTTAAARTVSVTLPAKARTALRGRKTVSAALTLTAKTTAGETRVTARVKKLR